MPDQVWHSFQEAMNEFGIDLKEVQYQQFQTYYELLTEWNKRMNLTAIVDLQEVLIKHFADSLSLVKAIDLLKRQKLIDVGTGAGFPGIPLKIAFPKLQITLLDSQQKRVSFLNEVIAILGLKEIEAIHGRAEDYAKPGILREQFDVAVSRAVANLATLSEYCLPFVKVGGSFIAYKSEKVIEEAKTAQEAIKRLGGKTKESLELTLPCSDIYRNLFVIEKVKTTPKAFPRKAGIPAKEPIKTEL